MNRLELARLIAAVAAALLATWPLSLPAAEPHGAVKAAILLREKMDFADEMFEQCQNTDKEHIVQYLKLWVIYHDPINLLERQINNIIGRGEQP